MYKKYFKRLIDIIISFIIILLLSPLFLCLIFLLFIVNKGSVFYTQRRPGKNAKIFYILKFKTMTDQRDSNGSLLPDTERITKVGKWLRSTSLDELPQMINVFKGEMSLIGPRPLLEQYLSLYSEEQARRHDVRPGITGWAQCHGRNAISWTEKFKYDVWYVDHLTLMTDLKIIYRTFFKVLKREGINGQGPTTSFFNGTN